MRLILATDVPPNFITRRPMTTGVFLQRLNIVARAQNRRRPAQKARIHSGAVGSKQPGSTYPREPRRVLRTGYLRLNDGALYRRYPAAWGEGAVFDQCALDLLLARDPGLARSPD